MSQFIYAASAEACAASLTSLADILDKALTHPQAASLPGEKLAPDMLPLAMQVQLACRHAVSGLLRLAGQEAPNFTRQELDLAGLKALAEQAAATLGGFKPADFAGADALQIEMKLQAPNVLRVDGPIFLNRWLLPNFYFHLVTAYDILRQQGLEIGKTDYLSHLAPYMHQQPA